MNTSHEKAVQAILYGHSCAKRLKLQLDHPVADARSVSNYDLTKSIVHCFSDAISIFSDKSKSEDDVFSDLSSRDYPPPLHQRSHSKKRKNNSTNSSENWRHDSPDPNYYDGFLWRKYGQKTIKQSKHQRSYYRCSYNIDYACGAKKHEQKIKDNPPVYRTTYFGHHTCRINQNQDAGFTTIGDPVDNLENSRMIRFGQDLDQETIGLSVSVKDEKGIIKEETMDQCRGITGNDKDCQTVIKENHQSSPSGSYTPSSSGSEIDMFDSDLLVEDLDLWDRYDLYDF
ncbi:probable WRKY transcription factor 38 [Brassica rapa]|uniref:WRKY domain-containing protein n=3 Tax=Brassica TaxID=3705 RepID=A0ABQ8E765_BRANA|nr:probable WRKY transcription factor 38 [Brassica rapa]XP_013680053.2 probable WRKY transcription factor 38 [Brassica napus]KAH0937278.1 hypothetical protein HID58_004739 [Brassica napus]CAF2366602.1 unnamed protein product [Brassica napus]CDY71866.1 BnaAnng39080D [Brassica napus]